MTFATIELSLLSVFSLIGVGSLLTMFFQWCSGLFDRSSHVEEFTRVVEQMHAKLTPVHGMLPAEPAEYTEHSPQIVRGGQYVDGYGA